MINFNSHYFISLHCISNYSEEHLVECKIQEAKDKSIMVEPVYYWDITTYMPESYLPGDFERKIAAGIFVEKTDPFMSVSERIGAESLGGNAIIRHYWQEITD